MPFQLFFSFEVETSFDYWLETFGNLKEQGLFSSCLGLIHPHHDFVDAINITHVL